MLYRMANSVSPFAFLDGNRETVLGGETLMKSLLSNRKFTNKERETLKDWPNAKKLDQCRYLVYSIYQQDANWSNEGMCTYHSNDELDDSLLALMGERLRIYDYCFITGKLNVKDVFNDYLTENNSITASDFQKRMFPFLRSDSEESNELFWPIVTNLKTGEVQPRPKVSVSPKEFNSQFWKYWKQSSHGKGIVLTMGERDVDMFKKQLRVLDHLGNKLPIQLVTAGSEYSPEFLKDLTDFLKTTNQEVYLVEASPILDPEFVSKYIVFFFHKWIAILLNTFEELVLIDADVVPFVPLKSFFKSEGYKTTGLLLFKDRNMKGEHTFTYCMESLKYMEPSRQETEYIQTNLLIDSTKELPSPTSSEEAAVYNHFFKDLRLHHVDSGLVTVNKNEKMNGLLMSFMLHLNGKIQRCVYGDKEFFWLGQLFAGQDYSIHPMDAGVAGGIDRSNPNSSPKEYFICSAQISHIDENQKLLWQNGGSNFCEVSNSATSDFEKDPSYFRGRYQSMESLKTLYDSPVKFDGVIIPDASANPWLQLKECSNYMYCAFNVEDHQNSKLDSGFMKRFDKGTMDELNKISEIWNQGLTAKI